MRSLRPLDIIVTRDRTPLSWWIRVKTSSEWSHVCLSGQDQTIYTTAAMGFNHVPAETYLAKKSYAIYRLPSLSPAQVEYGLKLCNQQLSKPYAYRDVLAMVLQNYKGHGVSQLKRNSKHYFCSEFVAYVYGLLGVKLAPQKHKDPSAYTPKDCVEDSRLECVGVISF